MTKVVGTPLRGIDFNSPSDEAVSARISGDNYPRIRIDAGGRITWSTGSITGDTKLYRSDSETLLTEGYFSASAGIITRAMSGSPTFSAPEGTIIVDTSSDALYIRSNSQWVQSSGSGGANVTVSDTAPAEPEIGDLWFDSTDATTYIYYDSFWVDINGTLDITPNVEDLADVSISLHGDGDLLVYSNALSEWVNIPVYAANPRTLTVLTSSVSTVIGTFPSDLFKSGEFTVELEQGSKTTATKVMVAHNDATAGLTQFGTVQIGSPAIPITFSTDINSGNVRLLASVSDAFSENVNVMSSKMLMRHLHN